MVALKSASRFFNATRSAREPKNESASKSRRRLGIF
jgi:hypothetical protein